MDALRRRRELDDASRELAQQILDEQQRAVEVCLEALIEIGALDRSQRDVTRWAIDQLVTKVLELERLKA